MPGKASKLAAIERFAARRKTQQALLVFSFLAACFIAGPAFCSEENVLTLHAEHSGAGKITIHLLPDRIKIIAPAYGGEIVSMAPKWDVVSFRRKEKMILTTPLRELQGVDSLGIRETAKPSKAPLKKRTATKVNSLKCNTYEVLNTCPTRTVWLLDDAKYSAGHAEVICRFFQFPIFEKIPVAYYSPPSINPRSTVPQKNANSPLNLDYIEKVDNGGFVLKTTSSSYSEASKKDFEIPSGYRKARSAMEIFFSNSQRNEVTDLLNEIGYQSHEAKDKQGQSKSGLRKSP